MHHPIAKSNTMARSNINIVVYLKNEDDKEKCEKALQAALPNVSYSLHPAMVGGDGMPEDEYNVLARYSIELTDRKNGGYPDRHPGNSGIEVEVSVFSGHHSTIEEMLTEYRQRGRDRIVCLDGILSAMGLSPEAVAEHLEIFQKQVLGLDQ
jgi:hypothetical protein